VIIMDEGRVCQQSLEDKLSADRKGCQLIAII
jgi:hypothetical protein